VPMLRVCARRSMVMRSPCAFAAPDPPLWIVPNNSLARAFGQAAPPCAVCVFITFIRGFDQKIIDRS
jgi:hypothetical protein